MVNSIPNLDYRAFRLALEQYRRDIDLADEMDRVITSLRETHPDLAASIAQASNRIRSLAETVKPETAYIK